MNSNQSNGLVRLSHLLTVGFVSLYVFSPELFAQEGQSAPPAGFGEILSKMMPMFVFIFLIFYFLVMKPQQDSATIISTPARTFAYASTCASESARR